MFCEAKSEPTGEERILLLVLRSKIRAHWRGEDFTPCFAKQNPSPLARRGFYSLFCEAKSEPTGEERILLLVLRSKIRAHWRGEDFTPCFAKQNPSPLARRGFYSLFCEAKSEPTGEERILLLVLRSKIRAHWRGEDFTPCFAKQNPSPLARRGFYSLFCEAKSEPTGEERILLLVLRSKIRAHWRGEDFTPCFAEQNAILFCKICHLVSNAQHTGHRFYSFHTNSVTCFSSGGITNFSTIFS